jgi:hypothetical protein
MAHGLIVITDAVDPIAVPGFGILPIVMDANIRVVGPACGNRSERRSLVHLKSDRRRVDG